MKSRLCKRGISTGYKTSVAQGKKRVKAKVRIEFKLNFGMVSDEKRGLFVADGIAAIAPFYFFS